MPTRPDSRLPDQLRPIRFQPGIAPHAQGSVLVSFGQTQVICTAMLDNRVPSWMAAQGVEGGRITAEYSMLPYSTIDRKQRDASRGKLDGRTVEIQRLIGRSLRAVANLKKLPGYSLWLDCDVLCADGGTRTAAITGSWVAARMAINTLLADGKLAEDPLTDKVAAISVGIYAGEPVLDLNYLEDRDASVDCNIVKAGSGEFVEIQGSGEEATFPREHLDALLALADKGITELMQMQDDALTTSQ